MQFYTMGVYHLSEQQFFDKLQSNNIDMFWDIRRRRGMRGSKYAFVNKTKLINKLDELNISYLHSITLSPTNEIRELQKQADHSQAIKKSSRQQMSNAFINAYQHEILDKVNLIDFVQQFKQTGAQKIVLFCVESEHQACHRSIVANELANMGYNITHL